MGKSKKNRFESGAMSEYYGGLASDTSDVFTDSLDSLSEDDLLAGTPGEEKNGKRKKKKSAGGAGHPCDHFQLRPEADRHPGQL